MADFIVPTAGDFDVMARTVWGEARGEPFAGQLAVAWVILNRLMDQGRRWPASIHAICVQYKQFSCWDAADPNSGKCHSVELSDRTLCKLFRLCLKAYEGGYDDPANGATHYFASGIEPPGWCAPPAIQTAQIGHHLFFKSVP